MSTSVEFRPILVRPNIDSKHSSEFWRALHEYVNVVHDPENQYRQVCLTRYRRQVIADAMHERWANFIRRGDPNRAGLEPTWPEFREGVRQHLRFEAQPTVRSLSVFNRARSIYVNT